MPFQDNNIINNNKNNFTCTLQFVILIFPRHSVGFSSVQFNIPYVELQYLIKFHMIYLKYSKGSRAN